MNFYYLIFIKEVDRRLSIPSFLRGVKMNEKKYEKRLDFQQKIISRQSAQIDDLQSKIERLEQKLKEKDEIINAVEPMRKEMTENINEQRRLKKEYKNLIQELKTMKNIIDEEVFRKRWWLIKFLLK